MVLVVEDLDRVGDKPETGLLLSLDRIVRSFAH
jgi:hypothetical protein